MDKKSISLSDCIRLEDPGLGPVCVYVSHLLPWETRERIGVFAYIQLSQISKMTV